MKKITVLMTTLLLAMQLSAQTSPLAGAVTRLNTAATATDYQQLANEFQRAAGAAPSDWLPAYYAAVSNMQLAFLVKDKAMLFADQAETQIKKAEALAGPSGNKKDLAEIYTVQSFIHRARVAADPMTNGRKYGPAAGQLLNKALQLDPQNPRALYLDGLIKFQTPAMWGGDKKKARAQFEAAAQQFEQPAASAVAPQWGKDACKKMLDAK